MQHYGSLYRGRLKDGRFQAERVLLPPCPPSAKTPCAEMTPLFVAATGREDVWVTVKAANKDPDYGDQYLLHLQAQALGRCSSSTTRVPRTRRGPISLRARTRWAAVRRSSSSARPRHSEEAQIAAAVRTIRGTPQRAERGRVGGEEDWAPSARRLVVRDTRSSRWPREAMADSDPTAKIVCAGMLTDKELELQPLE
jgi:hypothetical protein